MYQNRRPFQNNRDPRDRDRDRDRGRDRWGGDFRGRPLMRKRSMGRSPSRNDSRRSRSPRDMIKRENDKDLIDDNILSEISKLPEPSELWNQEQDHQEGGFQPPPFPPEVPPPNFGPNYQPTYSGIYDDFPPVAGPASIGVPLSDMASWNQMSLPPPPTGVPPLHNFEELIKKEAAIESEKRHQKAALSKQREDYIRKAGILKKELDTLKDQRSELRGDEKRSPSPDTKRFLKENTKLQLEIQNKLKTITNVVDMLNGIIGEEALEIPAADDSERESKRKSRSPSGHKFNYVYYDPELHWCRVCNEFPPTAKDYLNHLHSPAHHKMAAAHMEAPWHSLPASNEGFPSHPYAPTKRTPIRGLQFFVPSTAWYCKLCDQFIGDLHCASAHLKSITHSKNYINFVEQNPHWETDWMTDRQKAFEKSRASKAKGEEKPQYTAHTITFHKDGFHSTKNKSNPAPDDKEKEKKKKKEKRKKKDKRKKSSSSSSSSDSSSSDSEPVKKKKSKKSKHQVDLNNEKMLAEWMSNIHSERLSDHDRKLLESLKQRMKSNKNEARERPSREREHSKEQRRESERRETRHEERDRDRRREERRDEERRDRQEERRDRDDERRDRDEERRDREESRSRSSPRPASKKPEFRKMPFIGKMPVYKTLKKTEDQKKEDQKKKEDDEDMKKKREEMDAEIQKKVAEFKEKIAKAQQEREIQHVELSAGIKVELPPPGVYIPPLPTPPAPLPTPPAPALPAALPAAPSLPKDFQEALDIIFPSEVKPSELAQQASEFLQAIPPGFMPPLPMNPFQLGLMQPPGMFGFDLNGGLFPAPRAQLYDAHVPLVPGAKPRAHKPRRHAARRPDPAQPRNKEELDDLALLGIDASDVGAGI